MRHSPSRIERASSRMSSRSDSTPSSLGQATHCDHFLTEAAGRVDIHPPASLFTASTGCGSPSVPGRTKGHFSAPMRDSMQHPGYGLPRTPLPRTRVNKPGRGRIAHVTRNHNEAHRHDHLHGHGGHGHTHGAVDPTIATSERGIWAIKWSFVVLMATALLQIVVVLFSGSVALLSDTIHNFGDAATAVPLWIAFALTRLGVSRRFTFGYGRVEDLAGVVIVLIILFSAVVAGYQPVERIINP